MRVSVDMMQQVRAFSTGFSHSGSLFHAVASNPKSGSLLCTAVDTAHMLHYNQDDKKGIWIRISESTDKNKKNQRPDRFVV